LARTRIGGAPILQTRLMKKTKFALLLCLLSSPVWSAPVNLPAGSNLTLGNGSNLQLLNSYSNNPAMPAMTLEWERWGLGMGLLSSIGFGYEVGRVDNLQTDLEALQKELKNQDNMTLDTAEQLKERFDSFLSQAGRNGYLNIYGGMELPMNPLILTSRELMGGSLVFDSNISSATSIRLLDAPLKVNPLAPPSGMLETNSALYIKTAMIAEASLGYSLPVVVDDQSTMTLGVRGVYYMGGLRKTLIGLAVADGIDAIAKDEQQKSITLTDTVGLDVGALWQWRNHRLGLMGKNLNSPYLEYQSIGENCEGKTGAARDACYIAQTFAERVDMNERWVMDPQGNIELGIFNDGLDAVGQITLDTNPVNDALGNRYQWLTISGGYLTRSWFVPGVRAGIRQNLAGSKLKYVSFGLTFFKMVNLDVAYTLENVVIDGQGEPRSGYINLGFELLF